MKTKILALLMAAMISSPAFAKVEHYTVDVEGAHAFIHFKIKHLGYSWLLGRFNTFDGEFSVDPDNIETGKIELNIDVASIDSNHAERDKHLRNEDFLDVEKFPDSKFVSTRIVQGEGDNFTVYGDFTLHGVTKEIAIAAKPVGRGQDPWGGFRYGFEGTTRIKLGDYGIPERLGPASTHVDLELYVEGIRKN